MNNSLKLADFFFTRIQQTITYKQFIKSVEIEYSYDESFGNKYIRVSYSIDVHENFNKQLPFNEQEIVFKERPNFTFSLSTYTTDGSPNNKENLLHLLEFKQMYESLTAYVLLQLEKGLNTGTAIRIKGIDLWPWANYAKKYLLTALREKHRDLQYTLGSYESNVRQWSKLHQLAQQSKNIYTAEKEYFKVTDTMLHDLFGMDLTDVRSILINNRVPIHIKGLKTVDEVQIHTAKFVEALKNKINTDDHWSINKKKRYQQLIIYLYDHYLPSEKGRIIRQQHATFLKDFMVQEGDVVELADKRLVTVNSVFFGEENTLCFEYIIIKNDLQLSKRTRTVTINTAIYVFKKDEFMHYLNGTYLKRLSTLSNWIKKRKVKIIVPVLKPNLLNSEFADGA